MAINGYREEVDAAVVAEGDGLINLGGPWELVTRRRARKELVEDGALVMGDLSTRYVDIRHLVGLLL